MQKITPFLWFDNNAEEAMNFYIAVFKNSKTINASRRSGGSPGEAGSFITGTFEIEGQEFMVLNGGPHFQFSSATSFFVSCEDQAEVDYYWDRLLEGGQAQQCGWLVDKFGVTWQIIPRALGELLQDSDAEGAQRVMGAMMKMVKLDVAGLQRAADGG